MDNRKYSELVENRKFPADPMVPVGTQFKDDRGVIQNLLFTPINSVAVITSKAGSVRSNHYHKTDWHYLYVVSGSLKYFERDVDAPGNTPAKIIKAGEMFFTPPMKVHKIEFIEDCVMFSFAKNVRDHEHHEEDVVRLEF
jgi:quercetin dioxygenase-like cupin family protein